MTRGRSNIIILIASFIWGGSFIATQFALDANLSTLQIMAGRFLLGSLILDVIFFKTLRQINKDELVKGSIIGLFLFIGFIFQILGQKYSTPSVCAFVSAMYVVMIPFFDWYVYKKRPTVAVFLGAIVALVGVVLISVNDALVISFGAVLTFIAAICYTFQVGFMAMYTKKVNPIALAVVMINVNAIFATVGALAFGFLFQEWPVFNFSGVAAIVFLGVFCTAITFVAQSIGQKYTTATQAGLLFSTESVFAVVLSVMIFHEMLSVKMVIGCVLVFLAILISEIKFGRQ